MFWLSIEESEEGEEGEEEGASSEPSSLLAESASPSAPLSSPASSPSSSFLFPFPISTSTPPSSSTTPATTSAYPTTLTLPRTPFLPTGARTDGITANSHIESPVSSARLLIASCRAFSSAAKAACIARLSKRACLVADDDDDDDLSLLEFGKSAVVVMPVAEATVAVVFEDEFSFKLLDSAEAVARCMN